MSRKIATWSAVCWIAMALCCLGAKAQDTARVPDADPHASGAVDASVHADIGEGTKQTQPTLPATKRAPTYSRWGFPSTNQPPATRFRPAHPKTADPNSPGAEDISTLGEPSKIEGNPKTNPKDARTNRSGQLSNPFDTSSTRRTNERSTERQHPGSQLQPLPAQPPASAFSTPFRAKQFGGVGNSSIPDPFPKLTYSSANEQDKAKKRKPLPKKSDKRASAGIARPSSDQKKKIGRQLTVKPD